MLKIAVYNQQGEKVGEEKLNEAVFSVKINPAVIHQVAVGLLANLRQPLAHAKTRSEVRGGGRKPWRQKGTGRARHGSIRSPLWIGGGVTFGPRKERSYKVKINKKVRRKAILMVLSDKVASQRFILLDNLEITEAKTKKMHQLLSGLVKKIVTQDSFQKKEATKGKKEKPAPKAKITKPPKLLIVLGSKDEAKDAKILRAAKNLPYTNVTRFNSLNLLDLLKGNYIITEAKTVKEIEHLFIKK